MAGPVTLQGRLIELLRLVAEKDRGAFAELYRLSVAQLFSLAVRILGRRDVAEDVVQEAFLAIWRKAASFDAAKGSALSWMASITRNRALDRLRSERSRGVFADESAVAALPDLAPSPLEMTLGEAQSRALLRCLAELEAGPRDAILRVYFLGLTHAELAARSGIALGTVKSWIRRGLARLRACLER